MFNFIKCPFVVLSATYVKLVQKEKKRKHLKLTESLASTVSHYFHCVSYHPLQDKEQ